MRRSRVLWRNPGNPPDSVSRALGLSSRRFGHALQKIKAASELSGPDHMIIYSDGTVTDAPGEKMGNLYDED